MWLSEGKDAVGVLLLHGKQPNFFGAMYVFDLWQGIRREDTEMFTNPVRALEAIYVVSTPRAGGCKFGKRNRLGVKRNIYDQLRYVTELR
jgi:hypothetical protein